MSKPPPENLMEWPKGELAKEVARLRAITREHAESRGDDARQADSPDSVIEVDPLRGGGMHLEHSSLLDARRAVLMDEVESVLVDTHKDERVAMMLVLAGRINYSPDRVEHSYLLNPEGAAAIASHIISLVARANGGNLEHGRQFADEWQAEFAKQMRGAT